MPLFVDCKEATLLVELGLTISEARVYLALAHIGTVQIGTISKATGIHREHLYQIAHSLEKKGLIERELGLVSKYRAMAPEEILPILIKRKEREISELKTRAEIVVEEFRNRQQPVNDVTNGLEEESNQFFIVPKKEAIIQRIREAIRKSQTNLDVVTSWKRFSPAIVEFADDYTKALKRAVKIRIATEKPPEKQLILEIVRSLSKNPGFEVRYLDVPKAAVSVFDKKQAMLTTSVTTDLSSTSALWSNNACFVALAQNYFENQWNIAQKDSQLPLNNLSINKSSRKLSQDLKRQRRALASNFYR